MKTQPRTQDFYEHLPHYPSPPLIPIPEKDDFESLRSLGVAVDKKLTQILLRSFFSVTGFTAFLEKLPENLESMLRTTNLRAGKVFPPALSASAALKDDPGCTAPLVRAASLLLAARELYRDIYDGTFQPDTYRERPLEMGQYPNLFSTNIVFDGKKARMYKSSSTDQIGIILNGQIYVMTIDDIEQNIRLSNLVASLKNVVEHATNSVAGDSPAVLSSADAKQHPTVFSILQKSPKNKVGLDALSECFLILCLDLDHAPQDDGELAYQTHTNFENRWFHNSLQVVIFNNARAGIVINTSNYIDGNVMMRAAAELQKRGTCFSQSNFDDGQPIYSARKLTWEIDPELIERTRQRVKRFRDEQQATFYIPIGSRDYAEKRLQPVPTFSIGLHLTANQVAKAGACIAQRVTLSSYRCMGLTNTSISTPKVVDFSRCLEEGEHSPQQIREKLETAIQSQKEAIRKSRKGLTIYSLFMSYFLPSIGPMRKLVVGILGALVGGIMLLFGLYRATEDWRQTVAISHPKIYPEVTVIGRPGIRLPYSRNFALHYQIFEDKTTITMMTSPNWDVPNKKVIELLESNLHRILNALD